MPERYRPSNSHESREAHEDPLSPNEEKLFKIAEAEEQKRPVIQDFINFDNSQEYSSQKIAADQAELDVYDEDRKKYAKTKRGVILEYVIRQHFYQSNWGGDNCSVIDTTLYDDEKNKIDCVIEWEEDGKVYRLAVDVTSTQNDMGYEPKARKIRRGLDDGKMGQMRYFISEAEGKKIGSVDSLPKVVLALGRKSIQKLSDEFAMSHELFVQAAATKDVRLKNNLRKQSVALKEKNPVQILLAEQIRDQMIDQIEYCLGQLLNELDRDFDYYQEKNADDNKKFYSQLNEVLKRAEDLKYFPEDVESFLLFFFNQNVLQSRLSIQHPNKIIQHLNSIKTLQPILRISNNLVKEKSGIIEPEVLAQVTARKNKNVVLRNIADGIRNFTPPSALRLRLAA